MVMPQLGPALSGPKPILLWLLEGQVLSAAERNSLQALCQRESRLHLVLEMGGSRNLRWQPLQELELS
jgi:NAD(P)H-quinone oxidoreductase subunit N